MRRSVRKLLRRTVPFGLIGAVLGVPLSYQFQTGLVRALISRREHTRMVFSAAPQAIWNQLRAQGASPDPLRIVETLTFTVLMTAVAFVLAGLYITRR